MSLRDSHQLLEIHCSLPGGSKQNQEAIGELSHTYNCDPELINVTNKLFSLELKDVRAHQAKLRKEGKKHGLPFDPPAVIIRYSVVDKVMPLLEEMKQENFYMYQQFLKIYPDIIEARRRDGTGMGRMFNESDFPSVKALEEKWAIHIDLKELPDPNSDVRVGASDAQIQRTRKSMQEQQDRFIRQAVVSMLAEIRGPLANIVEKRDVYKGGRKGRFHNATFIGNVRDVVNKIIPNNLTDDPEIEEIKRDLIREICPLEPQELRDNPAMLKNAGDNAEEIIKKTDKLISKYQNMSTFGSGIAI
tara:strand:- start:152 stop:1060 length:909 start_codon:yes stop_codon:yes gene_type:complete